MRPIEPGHPVVFGDGFPTQDGRGKLVPAKITPPDEQPDAEFPFVLTTGRQLEHWHTGAMTRRASALDALEPGAVASVSRGTIAQLGIRPGDMIRVSTRRGMVELAARQDDAIPDGVVFIPFAFVEAAANLLTNPALDPFGKIPEFKYCAAKVERVEPATPHGGGVGDLRRRGMHCKDVNASRPTSAAARAVAHRRGSADAAWRTRLRATTGTPLKMR